MGAVINGTWSLSLEGVSCASPGDTAVGASSLDAPSAAGVCVEWWSAGTVGGCSSVSLAPGVTSVAGSSVRLCEQYGGTGLIQGRYAARTRWTR